MSNELQTVTVGGQLAVSKGSADAFNALTDPGFIKRLRLYTKGDHVTNGDVAPGHYAIPHDSGIEVDLGKRIDVLPLARIAQAEDWSDGEAPVFSYDMNSPLFKSIAEHADQGGEDNPCRYGVNFLLYERSTAQCLSYFLYGFRARPEAQGFYPYLLATQADVDAGTAAVAEPQPPQPVTLTARLKGKKYANYVPVVQRCSTPFDNVPNLDAKITQFLNVKETSAEVGETVSNERAR